MTVWAEQSTTSTNWDLAGTFLFKTEDDLFFLATEDNNTFAARKHTSNNS
jgi:hypothetical protein